MFNLKQRVHLVLSASIAYKVYRCMLGHFDAPVNPENVIISKSARVCHIVG